MLSRRSFTLRALVASLVAPLLDVARPRLNRMGSQRAGKTMPIKPPRMSYQTRYWNGTDWIETHTNVSGDAKLDWVKLYDETGKVVFEWSPKDGAIIRQAGGSRWVNPDAGSILT